MTILVAMHLGSHSILIADKYSFRDSRLHRSDETKLYQSENHTSVIGGNSEASLITSKFLMGRTVTGEAELMEMSERLQKTLLTSYGGFPIAGRSLMYLAATIDNQAKLFTVAHDQLESGGRLTQLTSHNPGEILFAMPRLLPADQGEEFKREATALFEEFIAGKGKSIRPNDVHTVAGFARSMGAILNKLSKNTEVISKNFDVSIVSSSGLTFTGWINFNCSRKVTLVQKSGQKVTHDGTVFAL